jgi:cytochrome c-type biogenesis protein CcmH
MRFKSALGILIVLLAAQTATAAQPSSEQIREDIANRVYCLCGCVTTLKHCPHPASECEMKTQEYALIDADIKKGKTEPQILQDFVQRYGVKVLAAPPAKGFNLTAWILPGVGLLFGLFIAVDVARRWRRPSATEAAHGSEIDPAVLAAVEEEMRKTAG